MTKVFINGFWNKLYPRDIIALIWLVCFVVLRLNGINGYVEVATALIIGYYFSKRVYEEKNGS